MPTTTPETDIAEPSWWRLDPQEDYRALLDHPGLWRDGAADSGCAARHADVLHVERDASTFASRADDHGTYRLVPSEYETTMISHDDPQHLAQRRIVNRRFTPRAQRAHAAHYQEMITELVDAAIDANERHGSVEIIDALAASCRVGSPPSCWVSGPDMWREVKSWSEAPDAHRPALRRAPGARRPRGQYP